MGLPGSEAGTLLGRPGEVKTVTARSDIRRAPVRASWKSRARSPFGDNSKLPVEIILASTHVKSGHARDFELPAVNESAEAVSEGVWGYGLESQVSGADLFCRRVVREVWAGPCCFCGGGSAKRGYSSRESPGLDLGYYAGRNELYSSDHKDHPALDKPEGCENSLLDRTVGKVSQRLGNIKA